MTISGARRVAAFQKGRSRVAAAAVISSMANSASLSPPNRLLCAFIGEHVPGLNFGWVVWTVVSVVAAQGAGAARLTTLLPRHLQLLLGMARKTHGIDTKSVDHRPCRDSACSCSFSRSGLACGVPDTRLKRRHSARSS